MTKRPYHKGRPVTRAAILSLGLAAVLAPVATSSAQAAAPAPHLRAALQTLTTDATPDTAPISDTLVLTDTATLTDVPVPGTLVFQLFGPDDTDCSGTVLDETTTPVTVADSEITSNPFEPTTVGTYRWTVTYTAGDFELVSACNAENESTVVTQAAPTVSTTVSDDSITVGNPVIDTATLTGGFQPTGTITFNVYGPGDDVCENAPVDTSTRTVVANASYQSDPFTPTVPGTYRFRADYSGDANNAGAGTACSDPAEDVVVTPRATPTITTQASPDVNLGGSISDTATLAGGNSPTGVITFTLFGPNDANCTGEPVTDGVTVNGNGPYQSAGITPTQPGTYRWIAAYGGDANNAPATTACNDAGESVVVRAVPVTPTLVTEASRDTFVGKPVSDTATLSGGVNPTGTITFNLYGPNDTTCSRTPVFTSTVTVDGNGVYPSGTFRPGTPGTYQWVAVYTGDSNNRAVSTRCGDPAEQVVVRKKTPYGGRPRP
ncbi:hypothetical protein [Catellatospora paridis]|uniref:hypothetical protein n=1 Tax=Catellatospora paridis TaxID=1617086 RepID=UPI0012D3E278|nr:hypothetical protein [Catellatospora paridis]